MIGRTVSHYHILSELGAGAMGIVYLAEDTRLKRHVAIKMLTTEYLERANQNHSRLLREARAISQINHPNIATIYDLGETADGQPFIAMEYIEGETLADILKHKRLSVSRSVEIIAAVASALSEAHSKGIIHRDIKPSNIIVNKRGDVKVLDFGLAKQTKINQSELSDSVQTFSTTQTRDGTVVGTPLYLSPEQALGGPIDQRSDIFSLGSVFYECLTGQPPFQASSMIEICARILRDSPPPPSEFNSDISPAIDEIVLKALTKVPQKRYQSANAFKQSLDFSFHKEKSEEIPVSKTTLTGNDLAPSPTLSGSPIKTKGDHPAQTTEKSANTHSFLASKLSLSFLGKASSFSRAALTSTVFVLACALGYVGYGLLTNQNILKISQPLQQEITELPGEAIEATISPDGQYVAWIGETAEGKVVNLTQRYIKSTSNIALPSKKGYSGLTFSPDGNYVYYLETEPNTGTLYRVTKQNVDRRKLLDRVDSPISFSPDGSRITFVRRDLKTRTSYLVIAHNDGTNEWVLSTREQPEVYSWEAYLAGPIWHPKENIIVCPTMQFINGSYQFNLEAINVDSHSAKRINRKPFVWLSGIKWLADGSGFVATATEEEPVNDKLYFISYPDGQIEKLSNSTDIFFRVSFTQNGQSLLTTQIDLDSSIWLISADNAFDAKLFKPTNVQSIRDLAFLSNKELLYTSISGDNYGIWRKKIDDDFPQLLLSNKEVNKTPTVSADGQYIFFVSYRSGAQNLWRMKVDGTELTQLTFGSYEDMPQITPDNQWILYHTGEGIWKMPFNGGSASSIVKKSTLYPTVSPNGKFLAYFAPLEQRLEVYSLNDMSSPIKSFLYTKALKTSSGLHWTHDSKGLSYVLEENSVSNIWIQKLEDEKSKQLTRFVDLTIFSFAWSPDGKQLACSRGRTRYKPIFISNFLEN